jgi:hypothetical protein
LRQADPVVLGRIDGDHVALDEHPDRLVRLQDPPAVGTPAEFLDGDLDVLEAGEHGLAQLLGPVDRLVHRGDELRIVHERHDARIEIAGARGGRILDAAGEEPIGLDDLQRERRGLQDHREQRIGVERFG